MATAGAASPGEPGAPTSPDAQRARLRILQDHAAALRGEAKRGYDRDRADCATRILVNRCLDEAKERRLRLIEQARAVEIEENALARELKRAELAERRAKKAQAVADRQAAAIAGEGNTSSGGGSPAAK
jgi:hypothetical protein